MFLAIHNDSRMRTETLIGTGTDSWDGSDDAEGE